jgi:hypothetical protein
LNIRAVDRWRAERAVATAAIGAPENFGKRFRPSKIAKMA